MKLKQLLLYALGIVGFSIQSIAQITTCPAPNPGDANCYQTSRPSNGNPLTNWPPLSNQDCCNAIPLCKSLNRIENGIVVPPGISGSDDILFPGCVEDELPPDSNTCFSNNEKATTWYKFQIRPLTNGLTAVGSPAGKLRFKIIPPDALTDTNYNASSDNGLKDYGETDYDFMLFDVTNTIGNDGASCTAIRNSSSQGAGNSVIASCNFSGTKGPTGLFEPGRLNSNDALGRRFNKPLPVKVGQVFYLAIDNYSVNQQGFFVDFRGSEVPDSLTAIVIPPKYPIAVKNVVNAVCTSQNFVLTFTNPVSCDSVKPNKFIVQGIDSNYVITSIVPQGGCNIGGQDTSFVFTISPFQPDTTLKLILVSEIKDICDNQVLYDTTYLRVEYQDPIIFNIASPQPSCGITELTIRFTKKVYCDSVKKEKFKVYFKGSPFGEVTKVRRQNGGVCTPTTLDSLYVITFSKSVVDTLDNLTLSLEGVIRDFCGTPVLLDTLAFRINKFVTATATPGAVCPGTGALLEAIKDSTFQSVSESSMEYSWKNLVKDEILVAGGDTIIFRDVKGSKVEVMHKDVDSTFTTNYRIYALNMGNSCLDSANVSVTFSPKPYVEPITTQNTCFGEVMNISPTLTNAKNEQVLFAWTRESAPPDTLSRESEFTQLVDSVLISKGLLQNYVLNVQFVDSLGSCKSDPNKFKAQYGRNILPDVFIDSSLMFASILPADYRFYNQSKDRKSVV